MKPQGYHSLHLFVLGLAYGLRQICKVVKSAPSDTHCFLFSFNNRHQAEHYLGCLMDIASQVSRVDSDLEAIVREYNTNPLLKRSECWENMVLSFEHEEVPGIPFYDHSVLREDYAQIAQMFYRSHQTYFDALICRWYHTDPWFSKESDPGIVCTSRD
jgi:hypothetical protein